MEAFYRSWLLLRAGSRGLGQPVRNADSCQAAPPCSAFGLAGGWRHASTQDSPIRSVEQHEKECWSCQHHMKRGSYVCHSCEKLQPVDVGLNYFDLFGMPITFDLDLSKFERQYKLLQWSLHPDKVVRRPEAEREYAAQQATLINHAYSILRSPLSRANYILSLNGVPAGDQFEGTIADTELLMEVMEAREQVESTDDPKELHDILRGNQEQQQQIIRQLSHVLRQKDFSEATKYITHLTYLAKLEHEVKSKLPHNSGV